MAKIIIDDSSTSIDLLVINENFRKIEEAFNTGVLYRANPVGEPNEMQNPLDMNSNRIYNLPLPLAENEPFRLIDAQLLEASLIEKIKSGVRIHVTYADLELLTGWTGPISAVNKIGRVKPRGYMLSPETDLIAGTVIATAPVGFRPLVSSYMTVWYESPTELGVAAAKVDIDGTITLLEDLENITTLSIAGDWDID